MENASSYSLMMLSLPLLTILLRFRNRPMLLTSCHIMRP